MTFEIISLLVLLAVIIIREITHHLEITKLQELLRSVDITEYYRAKQGVKAESPSVNKVMEAPNDIAIESEDFDIRKVSEVIIDGKAKPIHIE